MEILAADLHFVKATEPLATVEIDIDSIPSTYTGYGAIIERAMKSFAARNPTLKASIYASNLGSVNFGEQTQSGFLGVAGKKVILDVLLKAFQNISEVRVRFSDYIVFKPYERQWHIENGLVWTAVDYTTWYGDDKQDIPPPVESAAPSDDDDVSDNKVNSDNLFEEDSAAHEKAPGKEGAVASRFRVARSDASVGRIKQTIETVFGLPEGSVSLCGPDGRALRSDATIRTLRKRWDA